MESRNKKLFIGADEAGYGPNLGPLIIAASAWEAPQKLDESQLCDAFSRDFAAAPWRAGCRHVPLGDSKQLYQPGIGLSTLESGLLAMLKCLDCDYANLDSVLANFCQVLGNQESKRLPWYDSLEDLVVPIAQRDIIEIGRLADLACESLEKHGVRLLAMRAVVVPEPTFNTQVQKLGSKGLLLSQTTLNLVSSLLAQYPDNAEVFCDRQGGRKNYMPILLDAMPDEWFLEQGISNARCSYRNTGDRSIDIHFSVGGDRFPPTALASMFAKYLRERLMGSFNAFWRRSIPDLKPTAGYPVDAKRFRKQIESKAAELGLAPDQWWRCK